MSGGNLLITEGLGSVELGLVLLSLTPAETSLTLVFESDVILTGDALDPAEWTITPGSGVSPVTVTGVSVVDATVTLTTTEHQDGGAYTLNLPNGIVSAIDGGPFLGPFFVAYTGVGGLPYLIMVKGVDARALDVVFNEAVREDDATTPENYVVIGPNNVTVVAAEKVTDINYRLITTEQDRSASYTLEVYNVRDLADNELDH